MWLSSTNWTKRSEEPLDEETQITKQAMTRKRPHRESDDLIIRRAMEIMESRLKYPEVTLTSPRAVRDYLRLRLGGLEHEVFILLFLDAQHRLIRADEMFRGTLSQTSVYPREVVKAALKHNAAAVIFAHNHPSGLAEPSRADELLTQSLKEALALVDCRVLDHFVVGGCRTLSFAERGLL
jgi:DNA repair protein RadC